METPDSDASGDALRRPRILVADDEPDTLGLIQLTLETAGFRVDTAANGSQALDRARHNRFDLIVLDVMMPDLSGYEVFRNLQSDKSRMPPVIFLTAKGGREDRRTGEDLGASAYLTKPTTRGQLLDTVRTALRQPSGEDAGG